MAEDIQGFILSIVGIGVILAVGLIVLGQLGASIAVGCAPYATNSSVWADTNGTNACQRITCDNNTLGALSGGAYSYNSTRDNCFNTSNPGIFTSTNFPMARNAAENATLSIQTNLSTVPNWIGILITVALAFIVLGYFYNR